MNFNKEKYQKYLPSKKFAIITSIFIVLAILIFVIFFMSSSGENFSITGDKNNTALKVGNSTLTDLIGRDTDNDGIVDWEEALWGTDKNKKITFNDTPDATYIENKKKELKIEQNVNEIKLTETEKFAREFFSSYSAMKSSGQIDDDTINDFSSALGQNIINPDLIDRYGEKDIITYNDDSLVLKQKYYENIKTLFEKYKSAGLGEELDIINSGFVSDSSSKTNQYDKLLETSKAYQDFAKKVIETRVPEKLSTYHLQIANNSNNIAISILGMVKITDDPIVGLSGLSQYQKYSNDLIKTVADLEEYLLSR